jgi:serpin B
MSPSRRLLHSSVAVLLALAACPKPSGEASESAAKTTDAKTTDAKPTDTKPTDAKPTDTKPTDTKPTDTKPTDATPPAPAATPAPITPEAEQALAAGLTAFAVDLHRELGAKPGNLFVSPASIAIAFAMVHAGAKGTTAAEIANAFHFPASADLHRALGGTLARWDAPAGGLELDVANRLFGAETVAFETHYLELTKSVFAAPLERLDFEGAPEPARVHINDWVASQTKDKIRDLLPASAISPATQLVLVNAIYFKGKWAEAFERRRTHDAPFIGGSVAKTAKLMHRVDRYRLGVDKAAKVRTLELPYRGGEYSMVIVLPDDTGGLAAVEAELTAGALTGWIDSATLERVELHLPRFRIEPGDPIALRPSLETLGVVSAWDPAKADFTGMAPAHAPLRLSQAYHKAFVAVDEAGTEAAAATAGSMMLTGIADRDEPVPFVVDHPFLFLVRDTRTGAILFMGRIVDP